MPERKKDPEVAMDTALGLGLVLGVWLGFVALIVSGRPSLSGPQLPDAVKPSTSPLPVSPTSKIDPRRSATKPTTSPTLSGGLSTSRISATAPNTERWASTSSPLTRRAPTAAPTASTSAVNHTSPDVTVQSTPSIPTASPGRSSGQTDKQTETAKRQPSKQIGAPTATAQAKTAATTTLTNPSFTHSYEESKSIIGSGSFRSANLTNSDEPGSTAQTNTTNYITVGTVVMVTLVLAICVLVLFRHVWQGEGRAKSSMSPSGTVSRGNLPTPISRSRSHHKLLQQKVSQPDEATKTARHHRNMFLETGTTEDAWVTLPRWERLRSSSPEYDYPRIIPRFPCTVCDSAFCNGQQRCQREAMPASTRTLASQTIPKSVAKSSPQAVPGTGHWRSHEPNYFNVSNQVEPVQRTSQLYHSTEFQRSSFGDSVLQQMLQTGDYLEPIEVFGVMESQHSSFEFEFDASDTEGDAWPEASQPRSGRHRLGRRSAHREVGSWVPVMKQKVGWPCAGFRDCAVFEGLKSGC